MDEQKTAVKLAAIGIGVKRWVTIHGFALNINMEVVFLKQKTSEASINNIFYKVMNGFEKIRPCGIERDEKFTVGYANAFIRNKQRELITMDEARQSLIHSVSSVFGVTMLD